MSYLDYPDNRPGRFLKDHDVMIEFLKQLFHQSASGDVLCSDEAQTYSIIKGMAELSEAFSVKGTVVIRDVMGVPRAFSEYEGGGSPIDMRRVMQFNDEVEARRRFWMQEPDAVLAELREHLEV